MLVQWRGHLTGLARLFVDAAFEECAHPPEACAVKRVEKFVPRRFVPAMAIGKCSSVDMVVIRKTGA